MGTFHAPHMIISEANRVAPMPRVTWFFPENFVSTPRTAYSIQPTEISPEVGFPAIPIRCAGPKNEASRNINIESDSTPTPSKKQKIYREDVDLLFDDTSLHKELEKGTKRSKKKKATIQTTIKHERRNLDLVLNSIEIDVSGVPPPVCTCTGVPRQCYRWGGGRWQSSCCTTNISQFPLPMRPSRPGSRMSGRKMSHGAYVKLLQRLATEGHDLSHPVDLKVHWARLGTNKFVTIR